jgi:hypothetical protein
MSPETVRTSVAGQRAFWRRARTRGSAETDSRGRTSMDLRLVLRPASLAEVDVYLMSLLAMRFRPKAAAARDDVVAYSARRRGL